MVEAPVPPDIVIEGSDVDGGGLLGVPPAAVIELVPAEALAVLPAEGEPVVAGLAPVPAEVVGVVDKLPGPGPTPAEPRADVPLWPIESDRVPVPAAGLLPSGDDELPPDSP